MVLSSGLLPASGSTDFTDKDFDALRARLQSLIRSIFTDWTDFNVANFGNILLESFAFVGEVFTYYQDNEAGETRWGTATQRRNLINLCKLIGFVPATNKAASVDETITLSVPPIGKVTFGAGTVFSTQDVVNPTLFQLLADAVIAAGAPTPSIIATIENSENQSDLFASSGLPSQAVRLSQTPYIDGSAVVGAGNGIYEQVSDFLSSSSTDRHFTVQVDQNDRATITFGDGVSGALPTGTISVNYKTGGGTAGNVEPGTITKVTQSFADEFGNPVTVSATNVSKASGGADRQTVAQIQKLAPVSIRAINRSVSREDFEINTLKLSQIARALMLTKNEDSSVPENTGILFPIPVGGGLPSADLKALVLNQVTVVFPSTLTFTTLVLDPIFLPINVSALVFLKQNVQGADARAAVIDALTTYFEISNPDGTPNTNVDFGFNIKNALGLPAGAISWSDLFDVVREATGIRKIGTGPADFLLNGLRADAPISNHGFPVLGTVSLVNGDTGQPL